MDEEYIKSVLQHEYCYILTVTQMVRVLKILFDEYMQNQKIEEGREKNKHIAAYVRFLHKRHLKLFSKGRYYLGKKRKLMIRPIMRTPAPE